MEEKKQEQRPQYFYFNDEGKLVVESNKGVWVDGEQTVKMYGNFTCNAKTMGIVIEQLRGVKVDVGMSTESEKNFLKIYIKMYSERLQEIAKLTEENTQQKLDIANAKGKLQSVERKIKVFNTLPWWKRMFKKVEI